MNVFEEMAENIALAQGRNVNGTILMEDEIQSSFSGIGGDLRKGLDGKTIEIVRRTDHTGKAELLLRRGVNQ
ncbi:MAG TPA: hypothetical protein PK639_02470 [Candidatus Woesebacteria bacterium]|nr:hypothetical protein [Candidatus Woesebacteria bacterium]